ncbi:hypothetical protein MUP38_06630, partial [Candidatus Bathyarchaeota archaeon]|nr:hypothetical protein [Candidatus Bathyarchaeota archaeon]
TGFMQTEEVKFGTLNLNATTSTVSVLVKNTGTASVTISEVYFSGSAITALTTPSTTLPFTIVSNGNATLSFAATVVSGNNYLLKVVTSKANPFTTTGIAP